MEFTLHRQLKKQYAGNHGATEVTVGSYRIDARSRRGELIEVQFASLSSIHRKIADLLEAGHRIKVVKPLVARRRIYRRETPDGPIISCRRSPYRGTIFNLFEELVYFAKVFPHPRLTLEVPLVAVEEWRLPPQRRRRRRFSRNYRLHDVTLQETIGRHTLKRPLDLAALLPWERLQTGFSTQDLAVATERPRWIAQKMAYCLRHMQVVELLGRDRQGHRYQFTAPILRQLQRQAKASAKASAKARAKAAPAIAVEISRAS